MTKSQRRRKTVGRIMPENYDIHFNWEDADDDYDIEPEQDETEEDEEDE
jgi:hypothetical protein